MALGFGSNLGDSEEILRRAIRQISRQLIEPKVGPLVRSAPIPKSDQPDYLNTVVVGEASIQPRELLSIAQQIEWDAGRRLTQRDAARLLDIDILLWGDLEMQRPELVIPHPRLRERRFVLEPLAELIGSVPVPPDGRTVDDLLEAVGHSQAVTPVKWFKHPLS